MLWFTIYGMDIKAALQLSEATWEEQIVPELTEYIRIPAKSPHFDPKWAENGHIDAAVAHIERWCRAQDIAGLTVEVVRLEGRTPLIYMEVPGTGDDCVLLYGHLDKQPEMTGWADDLGPWKPVRKGDKLYGRGGADDGYAAYASLTAIRILKEQGIPHARCVIIIEACEESGSYDLPYYIDHLADRIGNPSLVVCLDSGCGNYDQMWCTTSLRGIASGNLKVDILTEGVHSGDASGVVPSSFRIIRKLLSRLEDEQSGKILPEGLHAPIPKQRIQQAEAAAAVLGDQVWAKFPLVEGASPMSEDLTELVLNRTWRPALSITGANGMPTLDNAGNVLRPNTAVKVSLRVPPTVNAKAATQLMKELFENSPPYDAKVTFEPEQAGSGWNAPALASWLEKSLDAASKDFFGPGAMYMGEGGSIPFMGMLGEKFPDAQFMITGVLGPHSNAHGPNEFLHIEVGKKLTCCVSKVLADHHTR